LISRGSSDAEWEEVVAPTPTPTPPPGQPSAPSYSIVEPARPLLDDLEQTHESSTVLGVLSTIDEADSVNVLDDIPVPIANELNASESEHDDVELITSDRTDAVVSPTCEAQPPPIAAVASPVPPLFTTTAIVGSCLAWMTIAAMWFAVTFW
jgi:hypothetical protein